MLQLGDSLRRRFPIWVFCRAPLLTSHSKQGISNPGMGRSSAGTEGIMNIEEEPDLL